MKLKYLNQAYKKGYFMVFTSQKILLILCNGIEIDKNIFIYQKNHGLEIQTRR